MPPASPTRRVISEPRIALLAMVAVLVFVLCAVALADTDDVWIIVVTVLAMILITFLLVIDIGRIIDSPEDDADE